MISLKRLSMGRHAQMYLMRHVSRGDLDTGRDDPHGATPLTRYYTASGYPSGRWVGSGLSGFDTPIEPGTVVEDLPMSVLFGEGRDPTTGAFLGRAPVRYKEHSSGSANGSSPDRGGEGTPERQATGGFDLTFTTMKSISALWAVGDEQTQQIIVDAHHAATADIIDYLEREVIFTRVGAGGVAQIDTRGLIATAFDHFDTRGDDPNLHTHLVVANRVQGHDGKWRTIDSRCLHKAVVAVSELYDAILADRLTNDLGVGWDARRRSSSTTTAHEVTGIPEALIAEFSTRGAQVSVEREALEAQFFDEHGQWPSERDVKKLRDEAAVRNRTAKRQPVPLNVLCERWRARAEQATGSTSGELVSHALSCDTVTATSPAIIPDEDLYSWASLTVNAVQNRRSVWNRWNLITETIRLTRGLHFEAAADREAFTHNVVDMAEALSIMLSPTTDRPASPALSRSDGTEVFRAKGSAMFTSEAVVGAERYLVERSAVSDSGVTASITDVDLGHLSTDQAAAVAAIAESSRPISVLVGPAGTGKTTTLRTLADAWVREHGGASVIGLAPSAGAADVLGSALAIPCENTAKWLYESVGEGAVTREARLGQMERAGSRLSKTRPLRTNPLYARIVADKQRWTFRRNQLVIIDEASLAGTLSIAGLVHQAEVAGAKVLLVGDPAQLSAVDAGGALSLLARNGAASELTTVWRFDAEWERDASIRLRNGAEEVIAEYDSHGRIHDGTYDDVLEGAYSRWIADTSDGASSVLIAGDNTTVRALNERARRDLVALGRVKPSGVTLSGGTLAGIGDRIITRRNERQLSDSTGWVRNGDVWRVVDVRGGALVVRRGGEQIHTTKPSKGERWRSRVGIGGDDIVTLPVDYVAKHVGLAYATTAHRAQGITVDTSHAVVTQSMTRELLYVAMTRGRKANSAWVATDSPHDDPDDMAHVIRPTGGIEVLTEVLARSGADRSALEVAEAERLGASHMATLIPTYEHAALRATEVAFLPTLRSALPPGIDLEELRGHDTWTKLIGTLRSAALYVDDLDGIIREACDANFGDEADPVNVIAGRVNRRTQAAVRRSDGPRYIAGMVAPAPVTGDAALDTAVAHAGASVERRADVLVSSAHSRDEPWLAVLGEYRANDDLWRTAAVSVATYRERWGVTAFSPLGPSDVADPGQQRDRRRAERALDNLRNRGTTAALGGDDGTQYRTHTITI